MKPTRRNRKREKDTEETNGANQKRDERETDKKER